MRSIMQEKEDHQCYLCMLLCNDYRMKQTQEHHVIFGTANRRLSEKYGLKVYLCLNHHKEGPESAHRNAEIARMLKGRAQMEFERRWPELSFRMIFGKNYLTAAESAEITEKKKKEEVGMTFIPDGVEGIPQSLT